MNMPVNKALSHENKVFATLVECAQKIYDPRDKSKVKYPLYNIIVLALCGLLGGANNWVEIADFAKSRRKWIKKYLKIPCRAPSHDTFSRVFSMIHPRDLSSFIGAWLRDVIKSKLLSEGMSLEAVNDALRVINIDGKIIESYSSDDPLILVRAWCNHTKSVLEQFRVPAYTNEINAIPELLNMLLLEGKIITIDAIGTQKKIVKQIRKFNGHYLLSLKGNQHVFFKDVKLFLDSLINGDFGDFSYHETLDKDHGRIEKRRCWSTENISWLTQRFEWEDLKSISVVETTIEKMGKVSTNKRYIISDLNADAERIMRILRGHWSIENGLHWHLDVTFNEDKSTIKRFFGPQNISFMRSVAVSLLGTFLPELGFSRKRRFVNNKPSLLRKILLNLGC